MNFDKILEKTMKAVDFGVAPVTEQAAKMANLTVGTIKGGLKEFILDEEFTDYTFNSHKNHNPKADILQGHLGSDTFITYGIYVNGENKGQEFMEVYSGSNYNVGSTRRSNSRVYAPEQIPAKYKPMWEELKRKYQSKYAGSSTESKEFVEETSMGGGSMMKDSYSLSKKHPEEYMAGRVAKRDGKPESANPYLTRGDGGESPQAAAWQAGWENPSHRSTESVSPESAVRQYKSTIADYEKELKALGKDDTEKKDKIKKKINDLKKLIHRNESVKESEGQESYRVKSTGKVGRMVGYRALQGGDSNPETGSYHTLKFDDGTEQQFKEYELERLSDSVKESEGREWLGRIGRGGSGIVLDVDGEELIGKFDTIASVVGDNIKVWFPSYKRTVLIPGERVAAHMNQSADITDEVVKQLKSPRSEQDPKTKRALPGGKFVEESVKESITSLKHECDALRSEIAARLGGKDIDTLRKELTKAERQLKRQEDKEEAKEKEKEEANESVKNR